MNRSRRVKLSSIIEIISGGTPKTSEEKYWTKGTIDWLSVNDFNNDLRFVYQAEKKITELGVNSSNTKFLKKGDIIISARGTVGALAQIGVPMCFNQSCFGLRGVKGKVLNDYLYYALKNYVLNIKKRSQGSVFDTINLKSFDLMEIDIHELTTQTKIATVLSTLDKKIALNNRINTELEAMAKTLYDYWFVQFDFPISEAQANALGKPELKGKPYKSSGGKMVFNEALKREIPEGWGGASILAVANLLGGGTPTKKNSEYWSGHIPFFTPTDADGTIFKFSTESYITDEGLKNSSTQLFLENTVLITARGSVGKLVLAGEKMAMNQSCYALQAKEGISYAYLYFLTKELIYFLKVKASGSVFNSIVSNDIKLTNLSIPKQELVEDFAEIIEPMFETISINTQENQQLTQLRDWLLPMLMNGQVTVK